MLDEIIRASIFFQISPFGIQLAISLFEFENVSRIFAVMVFRNHSHGVPLTNGPMFSIILECDVAVVEFGNKYR